MLGVKKNEFEYLVLDRLVDGDEKLSQFRSL